MPDGSLTPAEAKAHILKALETGRVRFTSYCRGRMAERSVTEVEIINVLRGGVVEPAEFERGAWRYRVRANRIYVVVELEEDADGDFVLTITLWRQEP